MALPSLALGMAVLTYKDGFAPWVRWLFRVFEVFGEWGFRDLGRAALFLGRLAIFGV